MRLLLDTSVYSAFMRGHPEIKAAVQEADELSLNSVTLGELFATPPIPTNDIWIAASAMQHGLRLLTTDAHYQKIDQVIVDYLAP